MINLPQLQAVMAAATKFIGETAPEKLAALHNLANASKRETFRICITGGFSRGKSHLLNELLGADLLPEAAVPTTGCVTEICYGERPELEIIQDGKVKRQTLDKEALRAWTIGECQPGAVTLRIFCPDPLLERGLVLIDTPGVEDTIAESADQAYKALENADAAIVLISAVAPFSLTEQQFVHAYMQDRSIPLLAFCVSFLDQVAPGSEGQQLNYIRKKCAELYPGCPLLTAATPTPDPAGYICGIANIRKQLKEWEDLPELPRLRAKMILDRLSALLTAQNQKLEATLKLLNSDYQTKQREIREAIAKIDGHSDVCDKLRTEFGEKAEDIASIARRRIRSFGENCAADLEEKNFSEDELVESFQHLYEELAAYVKNGLQADIERLSRKMRELYSLPLNLDAGQYIPPSIGIPLTRNTEPAQSSAWMVEEILRRGQIFMDTYGNKLPYINLVWPVLRPYFLELLDKAKLYLPGGNVEHNIQAKQISLICSRMSIAFRDMIDTIYTKVFDSIRETRLAWLEEQENILKASADLKTKQQMIDQAKSQLEVGSKLDSQIKSLLEQANG